MAVKSDWFQSYIDDVVLSCWKTNPHTIYLFKQDYLPDVSAIETMQDIPPAVLVCSANLVNRQCQAGVVAADNPVFANAATKGPFGGFIIADDIKGVPVLIDCDVNGLNIHMNASDIILAFNECGIAAL